MLSAINYLKYHLIGTVQIQICHIFIFILFNMLFNLNFYFLFDPQFISMYYFASNIWGFSLEGFLVDILANLILFHSGLKTEFMSLEFLKIYSDLFYGPKHYLFLEMFCVNLKRICTMFLLLECSINVN